MECLWTCAVLQLSSSSIYDLLPLSEGANIVRTIPMLTVTTVHELSHFPSRCYAQEGEGGF